MTLLTYIEKNDIEQFKGHLSHVLRSFAESVTCSDLIWDSAEEVMYYFILDLLTTLAYSLRASPERHQDLIQYMYNVMNDIKRVNNERHFKHDQEMA